MAEDMTGQSLIPVAELGEWYYGEHVSILLEADPENTSANKSAWKVTIRFLNPASSMGVQIDTRELGIEVTTDMLNGEGLFEKNFTIGHYTQHRFSARVFMVEDSQVRSRELESVRWNVPYTP